jgi:hypothetical protein
VKVRELIALLSALPEGDRVVVWNGELKAYLPAEGVRHEDGKVEVAATGAHFS